MYKISANEYKTRYDWVDKVIHWELCKKLKFAHTCKWYMHSAESILENKTHKLFWDLETETYPLILARRPELVIVNKKKKKRTCRKVIFAVSADHWVKSKESESKIST